MNVQCSAYSAAYDFQDPGSHSVFPSRASVKPFFALGLLHRLWGGVGGSRCPTLAPFEPTCWGPAGLLLYRATLMALHIIIVSSRRMGFSGAGRKGGWESEERQDGKPTHCMGEQLGPNLPTPVGNAEIPDICFHAKLGQNSDIFKFR